MKKSRPLKDLVTEENIRVHAQEAGVYEIIHPQIFNWYHDRKSWRDIRCIFGMLGNRGEVEVLDLGCGTGFLTMKAVDFPYSRVTAVDLSKEMLSELEKKALPSQKDRLLLVNREALDFMKGNDTRYDLIMASAFLHHLVDLKEFVDLALKRLKTGGILYIAYEPLKQEIDSKVRFMFHSWLRLVDEFTFNLRMKLSKIEIDQDHEKSIADYQTTLGGIDPLEVVSYIEGRGTVVDLSRFAVRANGFLALVADKVIGSQNTFSVIFKKS